MTSQISPLKKGLIALGVLGAGYILLKNIVTKQTANANFPEKEALSVQRTRQVLKEIKYQMLIVSVNYAQKISKEMIKLIPYNQLQATKEKLKANIVDNYQFKQKVVLEKHDIEQQQFASALEKYSNDPELAQSCLQIKEMMDLASGGQYPDLSVSPLAMALFSREQVKEIYQEICLSVAIQVWKTMREFTVKDPAFDTSNDQHFKKAIKTIPIYQTKIEYLIEKGYKTEWGCPNIVFLKVSESFIRKDDLFRKKMRSIEKAYNSMIDIVSGNPLSFTQQQIQPMFIAQIKKCLAQAGISI